MKIVIIGAGRMGIRHAQGILSGGFDAFLTMVDINSTALEIAKEQLYSTNNSINYSLLKKFKEADNKYDICIVSSTANNRKEIIELLFQKGCMTFLIEKPIGQSTREMQELIDYVKANNIKAFVNLNMRLYDYFNKLKDDLKNKKQLQGEKVITVNTGTIGIGANGIHYLDLLLYLLDADKVELLAGEIDDTLIPSNRGEKFFDFGGWCSLKFYDSSGDVLGRAHLSLSSKSTVCGGWDIVCPHGRITINEIEQIRKDIIRKEDSMMPIQRYAVDYNDPIESKIVSPFLGDLTKKWIIGLKEGKQLLPSIEDSIKVHQLMFDWLSMSKTYKETFPIT